MRKHKPDIVIGVLTFILMGLGLLIIYAIGPMRANFVNSVYDSGYAEDKFFIDQLRSVGVAVLALVLAYKMPVSSVRKGGKWVLLAGLLACGVLAVMGWSGSALANCNLGACRGFALPGVGFQPAELLKIGVILYLSGLLAERKREGTLNKMDLFVPVLVVMAVVVGFVAVIQKDLGTTAVIMAIVLAMLVASGVKWRMVGVFLGVVVAAAGVLILIAPHRLERMATFGGEGDSSHIDNALMAIGTGGVFGVGVGNSVQATGYLPESINDSVFAVMGETFGFVGLMLVIGCFAGLLLRCLGVAERLEGGDRLVVVGVFAWIAAHVIINVAAMTGLIPLTGITLPLLSYGGTSMMFVAAGLGLVLNLSRWSAREVVVDGAARNERRRR